jgi:toxin ParE1/3/4
VKYRLLPRAESDVEAIADYVAARNPNAAIRLVDALESRWDLLSLHPSPERRVTMSRPAFATLSSVNTYFYRVTEDAIEIVRVLHGRRKIETDDVNA